jgi:hypothetical protein
MNQENTSAGAPKRNRELDGSITLRWIARELGVDEDEALGAVILHAAGIETSPELINVLLRVGVEGGAE